MQSPIRLLEAARRGDTQCIAALLTEGANADAAGSTGAPTALMEASSEGHLAAAKALLKAGADAMYQDINGRNALMLAARGGYAALTAELLAAGVPWNALDLRGECAGDYAAAAGQAATAELLLEAGAFLLHIPLHMTAACCLGLWCGGMQAPRTPTPGEHLRVSLAG